MKASSSDFRWLVEYVGRERTIEALKNMLLIRHFEVRGEAAYQQGLVGGFYHSYAGEEAIQVAAVQVFGRENWWVGFYRCHAMALLLGATPEELMAELFGRANGNAKGRGGSMHLYTERMLGGFAIVGGHLPIAAGAAYSLKYRKKKEECVLCFLGEGAVAQGAFHESLNLASLWSLPVVYVIENNQWGMGTHVSSALCVSKNIAETLAPAYNMKGYTVDGMDYFSCYRTFTEIKKEREKTDRPILVECVCERLRGHSISDPGLYRTKESLQEITQRDPILLVKKALEADGLSAEEYKEWDKTCKERVIQALAFAQSSPWPSVDTLEKEVYAP